MKNLHLLILVPLLMLLILSGETKAWDTTAAKFYPLNIGDVHVYQYTLLSPFFCTPDSTGRDKVIIVGDTTLSNGKKYFIFHGSSFHGYYQGFERIDSSSMNVYSYQNGGDVLFDSLLGNNNDRFNGRRFSNGAPAIIVNSSQYIFNQNRNAKLIHDAIINSRYSYYLVDGFGLTNIGYCTDGQFQGGYSSELRGCIIRGVVYGDTTFTSIKKISNTIPEKFVLYQNYPNPFNPTTKIKFDVTLNVKRQTSDVRLVIYDALGKEVATLVNEKLSSGSYEVDFDGSNFPSGVYFYKLQTEGFSETKKLTLIK